MQFKAGKTLKNLLVSPKDKDMITKKSSVIYWIMCDRIGCENEYIGESSIMFGERYNEHLKAPSPQFEYQSTTSNTSSVENFRIIGREGHNIARAIKEAIYIRVNNPTLNKNIGKYSLSHIWDKVPYSIQELKISKEQPQHYNICVYMRLQEINYSNNKIKLEYINNNKMNEYLIRRL